MWVGVTSPQLRHCDWYRDMPPDLPPGQMTGVWIAEPLSCQLLSFGLAADNSLAWGSLYSQWQPSRPFYWGSDPLNLRCDVSVNVISDNFSKHELLRPGTYWKNTAIVIMITAAIIMMSLITLLPVIRIIHLSLYFLPAFLISTQMFCLVLFLQTWNDMHHPQTQIWLFPLNILMSVFPWQNKDCLSELNSDLNSHGEKVGLLEDILTYIDSVSWTCSTPRPWPDSEALWAAVVWRGGQGMGQVPEPFPFLSLLNSVTQTPDFSYLSLLHAVKSSPTNG